MRSGLLLLGSRKAISSFRGSLLNRSTRLYVAEPTSWASLTPTCTRPRRSAGVTAGISWQPIARQPSCYAHLTIRVVPSSAMCLGKWSAMLPSIALEPPALLLRLAPPLLPACCRMLPLLRNHQATTPRARLSHRPTRRLRAHRPWQPILLCRFILHCAYAASFGSCGLSHNGRNFQRCCS